MVRTAIALGSNLGNLGFLQSALDHIAVDCLTQAICSPVYETRPVGVTDEPSFLNAVVVGDTDWKPDALLHYLKELEQLLCRHRAVQNGPRALDLDVIAWGGVTVQTKSISVPHPRCHERSFVLKPLVDVWPDWVHPMLNTTALRLLEQLPQTPMNAPRWFHEALVPK